MPIKISILIQEFPNDIAKRLDYGANYYLPVAKGKHISDLNNNGNINIQMFIMIPDLTCFWYLSIVDHKFYKPISRIQTYVKRYTKYIFCIVAVTYLSPTFVCIK